MSSWILAILAFNAGVGHSGPAAAGTRPRPVGLASFTDEDDTADNGEVPTDTGAADPGETSGSAPPDPAEPQPIAPDPSAPPQVEAEPVEPPPSPQDRLEQAVRSYQLGLQNDARTALVELVIDRGYQDEALRQQARVYLGELLYTQGDQGGAKSYFEEVLRIDPDYVINEFVHPPDVCSYFNYIRSLTIIPPVIEPTVLPAAPLTAWAPLGLYHFRYGSPRRGMLYFSSQSLSLGANALLFGLLSADHHYPEGDDDERQRLTRLKVASALTTITFHGLWLTNTIDAHIHWRQEGGLKANRTSGLPRSTPHLVVNAQF